MTPHEAGREVEAQDRQAKRDWIEPKLSTFTLKEAMAGPPSGGLSDGNAGYS